MAFDVGSIQALADLITPRDQDSDSEDEKPSGAMARMNPGDVGPKNRAPVQSTDSEAKNKNTKDIWASEDVNEGQEFEDIYDPRPQPEYDIVYKQAISSEDMFLGMNNKTNATSSCEDMIVKIQLADTRGSDVELDVKDKFLSCRTPKFKLGLHLPHPVDSKNGRAQWDGDKCLLTVTLQMNRAYDFVNF
ncbi:hypothetical protein CAPTEDRAFT_158550 [Capitella teleta]|uniref:PIH1D1/2/3 CS-like domain-containing protein n=1 Tax=Capitella teleta TaxID=283909 RepID=R7V0Y6_CAPTE|nr:hypothetical protein CAPTEDRAFT_158550 [Capitella teleta]|eukprot:ELU12164.1 hypothetical protein CAPTEDRAFT_158550 [Capitella teleta]